MSQSLAVALGVACIACRSDASSPPLRPPPPAASGSQSGPAAPEAPQVKPAALPAPEPLVVQPDDPALRYGGWFDRRDPRAVRFAWPGTHIETTFRGTTLAARFTDTPNQDETRETDWLSVVVDDAAPTALPLREGLQRYLLAGGLAEGTHRVVIWKRTEAEVGVVTFHGFELAPGSVVLPAPAAKRRIVFVGDSVTAGYGSEGTDGSCHWSAATENNYATYGAVAARELQAEYVAAAWSGKGVMRNYDARDTALMSELRQRVVPTEETSPHVEAELADVVVVNLGTNDFFQGVPPRTTFIKAYRTLLEALRAEHPQALIVMPIGPMLADDYPQHGALSRMRWWVKMVRAQRRAAGDKRCELIEFWAEPKEGRGCDMHPSAATHARLGHELARFVREHLDW